MQLRFIHASGPNAEPANVDFYPGMNVINGPSNTGKSFIFGLIDFVLGAGDPPETIPEQAFHDMAHLGVVMDDGTEKTLVRALQGGPIRILDGLTKSRPEPKQGLTVSASHNAKVSLSKLLLAQLGASGARMRANAAGKMQDLSFRNLGMYALVDETKIQAKTSPVLSGQYTQKPVETSIFKYLLIGVDDSALDVAKPDPAQPTRQAAQLELLDQQIIELEKEIADSEHDQGELEELDSSLDEELSATFQVQESAETEYRQLTSRRRRLRRDYEEAQDRIAEIDTLQARFNLLEQHYGSDQDRLEAVIEAGTLFALEDGETCPICGAEPINHRPSFACEGDVASIIEAARAEMAGIARRAADLKQTIERLAEEREELVAHAQEILPQIESLQADILREVPAVQSVRSATNEVIARKLVVQKSLDLVRRKERLASQRTNLGVEPGYDSSTIIAEQSLNGTVLDSLCQVIEAELQSWQFPEAQRVSFELPKMDIAISGKPRRANGKGVRALLHGAVSVGIMKYCRERNRAHPGFLVMDSVFVTYRDPDDAEDVAIKNSQLKDRAFAAFSEISSRLQIIILDNVDVPEWLSKLPSYVHFTKQAGQGRFGFFPRLPSATP